MSLDAPRLIRDPISLAEVQELAAQGFGDMVKACVDVARGVMALGGELHSDEEAVLLDAGSKQADVGGSTSIPTNPRIPGSNSIR